MTLVVDLMLRYVRLYTDEAGDSRFEDATLASETQGVAYARIFS